MTAEQAGRDWLIRVLGVSFAPDTTGEEGDASANLPGSQPGNPAAAWQAAADAWRTASDAVDGQIGSLQASLNGSGDPELVEIANAGLNGLTGNHKVPLMVAMREIGDGSNASPKLARNGLAVVRDFRAHIASSEEIAAVDRNPFGVPVAIAGTLGPALARMEQALGRLAG